MASVVIVGGGIGGLCAALALADLGYSSTVLESRTSSARIDRGDILHAGVSPLLSRWGADQGIAARDPLRFHRFCIADHHGVTLFDADTRQLLDNGHYFTALRHPHLTAALQAAAAGTGLVDVVAGEHATELVDSDGRICGVRTATAVYPSLLTVVATGARSRLAGRHFGPARVYHYGTAFYNACVQAIGGYDDCGYYVLSPGGALVLVPLPGGLQRIGIQIRSSQLDQVAAPGFFAATVADRFAPLAGAALELVERPHTYRLYRATRQQWWRLGAVVVGDAARQVHPVGGQGMNLAIRDVEALAGCLAAAGCPHTPAGIDDAIASYAAQRQRGVRPALRQPGPRSGSSAGSHRSSGHCFKR